MRLEEWMDDDPARGAVDHVRFGDGWGTECPLDSYSVRWSPLTGELYAVDLGGGDVDVLAVIPDIDGLKQATSGWEAQQYAEGGLYWLRARVAAVLPPSLRDAEGAEQPAQGRRYRVDLEDGTWWELGWDRPLSTYYGQHYAPTAAEADDSPLAWKGTAFGELPDVDALARATGLEVPHEMAVDLAVDKAWFPNAGRPPFLDFAEDFVIPGSSTLEPVSYDDDEFETSLTRREAILELRRRELDQREADIDRRERQLVSQEAALATLAPVEPRWSLPAEPVIRLLHAQQRVTKDGWDDVAQGFGLDAQWVKGVLSGEITEVDLPHIAELCEGVHCSPYDLWGKEDAQTVLHAYGPELWPRLIEPLQDEYGMNLDPPPGVDL